MCCVAAIKSRFVRLYIMDICVYLIKFRMIKNNQFDQRKIYKYLIIQNTQNIHWGLLIYIIMLSNHLTMSTLTGCVNCDVEQTKKLCIFVKCNMFDIAHVKKRFID